MHTADAILVIADISGYTRFMIANQTELEHGHQIIATLLEEIITAGEVPLEIAKIEGDAVFLYMEKDGDEARVGQAGGKLPRLFSSFRSRLEYLASTLSCGCQACANVGQLRLKVLVHVGRTLVYEIAGRTELAGVGAIVIHRLLKNSITASEYLLLTEAAERDLRVELPVIERLVENVEDVGPVDVTAYQP